MRAIKNIIFALPFAWPVLYYRLPKNKVAKGLTYGLLWTIAVGIVSMISGALGATRFNQMPMNAAAMISNLLLHLIWGFCLGVIYSPPQTEYAIEREEAETRAEGERRPKTAAGTGRDADMAALQELIRLDRMPPLQELRDGEIDLVKRLAVAL